MPWLRKLTKFASDLGSGQPHEAEEAYRRALQSWQKFMIDFPTAYEYNIEIANARIGFAKLLVGPLKRPDEALRVSREGVEQIEKLVADYPQETKYRNDLARATRALGEVFAGFPDRLGDAEKFHLQSLAQWIALGNVEQAGHSYRYLGWITRNAGRPDDAIANFEKGVAAFQKLAESSIPQRNGFNRIFQGATLQEVGGVLAAGGHVQEAENAYRADWNCLRR